MDRFACNSILRKLKRRWRIPPWLGGIALGYTATMLVSMVAWLTPAWHGAAWAEAARWIWCVMAGIGALLQGLILLLMPAFPFVRGTAEFQWTKSFRGLAGGIATFGMGAAAAALGFGRIDLAVLLEIYPETLFKGCWGAMNRAWWVLPGVALNLLVLLAFDAHAPWLVAIAMLLGLAVRSFFKPSLRESLAGKLTKAQHLRHVAQMQVGLQRLYKKRSDKCPTGLLQAFYEMELWGSAQRELQRLLSLPGCKMLDENLWQVKILLGAGHYKAAFAKMETASESERTRFQPYLALAYARTGRQDEAFRMAQSLARSKDRDTRLLLGDIYAALGLYDVALVCYERLAQYSQDAWAFHAAGMMLKALGEYREAGFMFTQALLAAPYMRTQDLLELSTCCWHLGQERDAMEAEMLAKEPQPQKSDMPQPLG